jgi:hypothetical protein
MFHFLQLPNNGPPVENTPEKKPPRNPKELHFGYNLYFFIGQYIM